MAHTERLAATNASKVWFCAHTTALWPVEQSSILSAKFDFPVAPPELSLLATAHDCETGLLKRKDALGMKILVLTQYVLNRGYVFLILVSLINTLFL